MPRPTITEDQLRAVMLIEMATQTTILALIAQSDPEKDVARANALQDALEMREAKMKEILAG